MGNDNPFKSRAFTILALSFLLFGSFLPGPSAHGAVQASGGPARFAVDKKTAAANKIKSVSETFRTSDTSGGSMPPSLSRRTEFDASGAPLRDAFFDRSGAPAKTVEFVYDFAGNLVEENIFDRSGTLSVSVKRRYSEPVTSGELKDYSVVYYGGAPDETGERPFYEFKFILQYAGDGQVAYAQDFKHSVFEFHSDVAQPGGGKVREYRRTNFLWKKYGDVFRTERYDKSGKLMAAESIERDPVSIDTCYPDESRRSYVYGYDANGRLATEEVRLSPRFGAEEEKRIAYCMKYSDSGLLEEKKYCEYDSGRTSELYLRGVYNYSYEYFK